VKSAKQRADVVKPRRRKYQPGGCIHYRLKSLNKVRSNACQGRVTESHHHRFITWTQCGRDWTTPTSAANIDRVQVVQNSVARVIYQAPWSVSATELRQQLHWLPVRQHIKMSSTTNWQSSPTRPEQPLLQYLSHLIHDYNAGMALSEIC